MARQRILAGLALLLGAGCSYDAPTDPATPATAPSGAATFGTLRITASTSGPEQDSNGYKALLTDLNQSPATVQVPANGTVDTRLNAGVRYVVVLDDIAPNCRIQTSAAPEQIADVVANTIVSVSFAIGCETDYTAKLPAGWQLAYVRRGEIHLVNSDGTGVTGLTEGPSDCDPSWSPDGQRLAFGRRCDTLQSEIFVMNADGSNVTRRVGIGFARGPAWSPDGRSIAFSGLSQGQSRIFTISADDDGAPPVLVVERQGWNSQPTWSPDGGTIAFVSDWAAYDFSYDIYLTPASGGGSISQVTSGFNFWPNLLQYYEPAWSPDGSKLAVTRCPQAYYTCDVSDLMVMNANGTGLTPLAATRGYASPTWSPDGNVIAFSSGGTVGWIRPSTGARGTIVADAESPAFRPMSPADPARR